MSFTLGRWIASTSLLALSTLAQPGLAQTSTPNTAAPDAGPVSSATGQTPTGAVPAKQQARAQTSSDNGEILVTARRVSEKLQDIPVAVSAFGTAVLKEKAIYTATDLSSVAPGLNIRTSSNDGQAALISLRGQVPAGVLLTTDTAVGVYVDGYNNPRTDGFKQALVDIARVEVLRGPQGTLYGRNTTGGAISVITNSPVDKWEGQASLRLGNYGTANAIAMINVPITDDLAIRVVGQRGVNNGYGRDGDGNRLADEDSSYIRAKAKYTSGRFSAELYGDYQSNYSAGPVAKLAGITQYTTPVGSGLTKEAAQELGLPQTPAGWAQALQVIEPYIYKGGDDPNARVTGSSGTYSNFRGNSAGADLKYEISDAISLRSLMGYRSINRENYEDYDGTPFHDLDSLYRIEDRFYSEEFQVLGKIGRLSFVAGAYGSYEHGYESLSNGAFQAIQATAGTPYLTTQGGFVTSKSLAGFVQANYKLTDTLTITAGGRYTEDYKDAVIVSNNNQNYINQALPEGVLAGCIVPVAVRTDPSNCRGPLKKKFGSPSWLGSVDWKVTNSIMVYGKVARGYRAGGENIRGTNLAALAPFAPETITEFEAGLKSDLFNRLIHLNVAVFHDNYNDVQRTVAIFANGASSSLVTNAAKAKIDGVEVEAALHPLRGLTVGANLAYIDARYTTFTDATGDRSHEDWPAPKWTYDITARYATLIGSNEAAIDVDYAGQSSQNLYPAGGNLQPQDVTQKAYGLLNSRISYSFKASGFEVAVFGKNLLDKTYADGGLAIEAGLGVNVLNIAPPRTYGVELTKTF